MPNDLELSPFELDELNELADSIDRDDFESQFDIPERDEDFYLDEEDSDLDLFERDLYDDDFPEDDTPYLDTSFHDNEMDIY